MLLAPGGVSVNGEVAARRFGVDILKAVVPGYVQCALSEVKQAGLSDPPLSVSEASKEWNVARELWRSCGESVNMYYSPLSTMDT